LTAKPEPVEQGAAPAQKKEGTSACDLSKAFEDSLSQVELAQRLKVNESSISRKKEKIDFPQWTRDKDPESVSWEYCGKTKRFIKMAVSTP
jgi:hypothetical protein